MRRADRAFSLVELLVVIYIIGLLAGLSSVAVSRAMESGKKAKAKGEASALVSAVKAYKQEYGRLPGDLTQSNFDGDSFKDLVNVLSGDSASNLGGSQPANPKGVRFFEGSKGGTNGLPDPWGNQYQVWLDSGETGSIAYPYAGTVLNLRLSVLAVSYGKDGKPDTASGAKDDVFSPDLR
jgi:prepilin-type N-terminal cleavage/methylation domain-containing protein